VINIMQRPVQVGSAVDAEYDDYDSLSDPGNTDAPPDDDSDGESAASDQESSDDQATAQTMGHDGEDERLLKSLSFGALLEAQEKFRPERRKRKLPVDFDNGNENPENVKAQPSPKDVARGYSRPKQARSSKHAPTVLSSTQQVSRKRDVFEPSRSTKSRDPRFDPTVQASNYDRNAVEKANKNYSFLTSYQAAEILEIKSQIKKTKDPNAAEDLKRQVLAIENKIRSARAKERARDIVKQHKQAEKDLIKTGQKTKPYYLKDSEVKKRAENERLEGMGKKARDKALERKRKREKSKEAKHMPRVRRE
jgi:ribosomal RNA-processing protein 36